MIKYFIRNSVHNWKLSKFRIFSFYYTSATLFYIKVTAVPTLNWMSDIIQFSKCVDDVSAQHWVNILNKKFTIARGVCSQSVYVANDNFVVVVDICTRRSIVSPCFTLTQIFSNILKGRWTFQRGPQVFLFIRTNPNCVIVNYINSTDSIRYLSWSDGCKSHFVTL
jgi:hypothetical protein